MPYIVYAKGHSMDNELETAAYYIPSSIKARIDQEAKKQDLNSSQLVNLAIMR